MLSHRREHSTLLAFKYSASDVAVVLRVGWYHLLSYDKILDFLNNWVYYSLVNRGLLRSMQHCVIDLHVYALQLQCTRARCRVFEVIKMNLELRIGSWYFNFMSYSPQRIEVPNICIIDLFKHHNHRYSCKAFFYKDKNIISSFDCNSKYKLYCAVQSLLKEFL